MPEQSGRARIRQISGKFAAMARDDEALAESKAMVEHFNTRLAANKVILA
jgi:hypothetical protein